MECRYPLTSIRAEVQNDWNYTSIPLPHILMAWTGKTLNFAFNFIPGPQATVLFIC